MNQENSFWQKCSVCKKEIPFNTRYYKCSVSSCSKKRAPVQFCSVSCWDAHNSILNHKNAGADEYKSPASAEGVRRRVVVTKTNEESSSVSPAAGSYDEEILVVISKFKNYVKSRHDLNSSQDLFEPLSQILRDLADRAAINARSEGRKTLMARDIINFRVSKGFSRDD